MLKKYLKVDLYRVFTSAPFWLGVIGVYITMNLMAKVGQPAIDVISRYKVMKFQSVTIAIFAFSSFAYGNALREDQEHHFWQNEILRGDLKSYIWSKVLSGFLAADITVFAGQLLFFQQDSFWHPLLMLEDEFFTANGVDLRGNCFGWFAMHGMPILYLVFSAIIFGLLGGILCLVSMLLSLLAKNQMFAICIPMAGYYFIVTYLGVLFPQGGIWDWNSLFMFSTDVFGNAWISLGYIFLMTILCVIVLGNLIAARVTKEIRGESM